MDKIRLAIVGCGNISQLNAPGYLQHPQCDVVALCDTDRAKTETRVRAAPTRCADIEIHLTGAPGGVGGGPNGAPGAAGRRHLSRDRVVSIGCVADDSVNAR